MPGDGTISRISIYEGVPAAGGYIPSITYIDPNENFGRYVGYGVFGAVFSGRYDLPFVAAAGNEG